MTQEGDGIGYFLPSPDRNDDARLSESSVEEGRLLDAALVLVLLACDSLDSLRSPGRNAYGGNG